MRNLTSKTSQLIQIARVGVWGLCLAVGALSPTILPSASYANVVATAASKPNEEVTREPRKVGNFNRIEVSSAIEVRLRQAATNDVAVEARVEMQPKIVTEVSGNTLKIYQKNSSWYNSGGKVVVYVSIKQLVGLDVSGASKLVGETNFDGDKLVMESSGASSVSLNLNYNTLVAEVSGASSLKLGGKLDNLSVDGSGASTFKAQDCQASAVTVDLSGASSASIHATKTLVADVSGASSLRYRGKPSITQDISGASSVKSQND
jgi:hypothetical protein